MPTQPGPQRQTAVDRIWSSVARTESVGLAAILAGTLLIVGALSAQGGAWLEPLRIPSLTPLVAGLLAAAVIVWLGVIWERFRRTTAVDEEGELGRGSGWQLRTLPLLGGVAMLAGAGIVVASWFTVQASARPGRMTLSAGEKVEQFESEIAGETVDVMLPRRVHLEQTKLEGVPWFEVSFSEAGGDPQGRRKLRPGESVRLYGYRIAPVGLTTSGGRLLGQFSSGDDGTIPQRATAGGSFKLSPQGPSYKVEEIVENYLGAVGPAARISSEEYGDFWVFERASQAEPPPAFLHPLQLDEIERAPAVVFNVSADIGVWPAALGGSLFVCGLALCLALPERVRFLDDEFSDEGGRVVSFNDAERLAEGEASEGRAG